MLLDVHIQIRVIPLAPKILFKREVILGVAEQGLDCRETGSESVMTADKLFHPIQTDQKL